ncbi:MAG TPA: 2-dehydropantoate 2-reductase [Thermoleophilaceae bacterium]|nr:2-dehydropantoate 2-reductase [Thermoleophilaceae bacterium]
MTGTDPQASVVVVGAGAMGSVFGGRLAEAGVPTTLLDTDRELVERLNSDGLRLVENGSERTLRVRASTDPSDVEPPTALLFFVKCHQTARAAELAQPLARDGAAVVSLQNGWGNADTLSETFGDERLVVGVTYTSATVLERGVVSSSGPGRTVLGPYADGEAGGLAETLGAALEAAGFPVEQPRPVLAEIWKKLVLNAATLPTAALTGLTAGALAGSEEMHALVDAAAAEAVAVGQAKGFELELGERLESIHSTLERAGSGKGSMLQDVEAGRRTEIDVISGAVLRGADEHGVDVPVTRALYALVTGFERARGLR